MIMGNIFLVVAIVFYITAAGVMMITMVKKQQAMESHSGNWDDFRLKARKWGISAIILAGIFNIIYLFTS